MAVEISSEHSTDSDRRYCVCHGECGNAQVCMICKKPVDAFHGRSKEEDDGYGGTSDTSEIPCLIVK